LHPVVSDDGLVREADDCRFVGCRHPCRRPTVGQGQIDDIHRSMDQDIFTKNKHDADHVWRPSQSVSNIRLSCGLFVKILSTVSIALISSDQALIGQCSLALAPICTGGVQVIAPPTSGQAAAMPPDAFDVILMDPESRIGDIELSSARLHLAWPESSIILLLEVDAAPLASRLIAAGVRGFLTRHASEGLIRKAVETVAAGDLWMSRTLLTKILVLRLKPSSPSTLPLKTRSRSHDPAAEPLTERETDVVRAAVAGLSNREIAEQLEISESTVKTHLHHAFAKLHLVRRSQLLGLAEQAPGPSPAR